MDRNNLRPRPVARPEHQPVAAAQPVQQANSSRRLRRPKALKLIVLIIAIIVAVTVAWKVWPSAQQPDGSKYQAVFLDTGAVYFGKLTNVDGNYLRLEKAYYTKQQSLPADATAEQKAATASNLSLVKVGDEVYGPENVMMIRAEQVLFWQDLQGNSKVAKAIDSAK